MQISNMFNSNAFASNVSTSNVFGSNSISSIRENKSSSSNNIFQNPQSRTDRVSISSDAMNAFEFELEQSTKSSKYALVYDENGTAVDVPSNKDLSLNEAIRERFDNAGLFRIRVAPEDMKDWSPENRALYQKLEKELQELRLPDDPSSRTPEMLEAYHKVSAKLSIVATHGATHEMTEAMVDDAAVFLDDMSAEHMKKTGRDGGGEGDLMSLLFPDLTEEEIKEKLKKLEDEVASRISSASASASVTNEAQKNATQIDATQKNSSKNPSPKIDEQSQNDMSNIERQRMSYGLKRYEKVSASAFILPV